MLIKSLTIKYLIGVLIACIITFVTTFIYFYLVYKEIYKNVGYVAKKEAIGFVKDMLPQVVILLLIVLAIDLIWRPWEGI